MDGLHTSSYFQVLRSLYLSISDCTKSTNYHRYHRHFHVPQLFFFQFPNKFQVLIFPFAFFFILFCDQLRQQSPLYSKFSLFYRLLQDLVIWPISGDPFVSQNPIGVFAFRSSGQILGYTYIYYLFAWSNFNFLHNSQKITLPTQSCLVLCTFCANLLHSLIMSLMVSSLSSHNLHSAFLLRLIYSCFDLISPYCIVFCCYSEKFSFSLEVFLSYPRSRFLV